MTIRRLPTQIPKDADPETERRLEAFISGGLLKSEQTEQAKVKPKNVLLALPAGFQTRIEKALGERRVRIPRHTWILEAIEEKLNRDLNP